MPNPILNALLAGAASHGAGQLGNEVMFQGALAPFDWPRRAVYNLAAGPMRAAQSGDLSHLLGMLPGIAGGALGGAVGGPLGILAGSALGGSLQGIGEATGLGQFRPPETEDVTGSDNPIINALFGMAADPLSWAGGSGLGRHVPQMGNALAGTRLPSEAVLRYLAKR